MVVKKGFDMKNLIFNDEPSQLSGAEVFLSDELQYPAADTAIYSNHLSITFS